MTKQSIKWIFSFCFFLSSFTLPLGMNAAQVKSNFVTDSELANPVFSAAELQKVETATIAIGISVASPVVFKLRIGFCSPVSHDISLPVVSLPMYFSSSLPDQKICSIFLVNRQFLI